MRDPATLHGDANAMHWTEAFFDLFEIDHVMRQADRKSRLDARVLLFTWFANAIETGIAEGERRARERSGLGNLLELLESWMNEHRRSPLDGTISCEICAVLVLEENADRHYASHRKA